MKNLFLIIFIECLSFVSIYSQTTSEFILKNINENGSIYISSDSNCYFYDKINFSELGLDIIPTLIDSINSDKTNSCFYCLKKMSRFDSYIPNIQFGEYAARYIELIINPSFKYNTIKKNGQFHILTQNDLLIIKELYIKWWDKNKQDSKRNMKKWRAKKGALDGTIYSWGKCSN
jgi:hypothetical protein